MSTISRAHRIPAAGAPGRRPGIYSGIGSRIKARSPLAHTMVTALANGSAGSGYIPTEEAFNRYTFQVLGSRLKPGCAEDGIVTAALELLSEAVR